jgi:hypothetical protein
VNRFDVSVHAIRRRADRPRPFEVRWRAAGRSRSKSFTTKKLADSYRAELVRAARMGLEFDPLTGEPTEWHMLEPAVVTWYEEATAYTVMKWPSLAAHSRANVAEALATVTPALTRPGGRGRPGPRELRTALYQHAFNPASPAEPGQRRRADPRLGAAGIAARRLPQRAVGAARGAGGADIPAGRQPGRRQHHHPQARRPARRARLRIRGRATSGQPAGQLRLAGAAVVYSPGPCRSGQPGSGQYVAGRGRPDPTRADRVLRLPLLRCAPPRGSRRPAPR